MSHNIEKPFIDEKIPYRMIGTVRFFDRLEIKDVLSFLRLAENTSDQISFERIVNVPPREIGKASLQAIITAADLGKISCIEVCRMLAQGKHVPGVDTRVSRSGLGSFVRLIDEFERLKAHSPVADLVKRVLIATNYPNYLKRKFPKDWEDRVQNVQELVGITSKFDADNGFSSPSTMPSKSLSALFESQSSQDSSLIVNTEEPSTLSPASSDRQASLSSNPLPSNETPLPTEPPQPLPTESPQPLPTESPQQSTEARRQPTESLHDPPTNEPQSPAAAPAQEEPAAPYDLLPGEVEIHVSPVARFLEAAVLTAPTDEDAKKVTFYYVLSFFFLDPQLSSFFLFSSSECGVGVHNSQCQGPGMAVRVRDGFGRRDFALFQEHHR